MAKKSGKKDEPAADSSAADSPKEPQPAIEEAKPVDEEKDTGDKEKEDAAEPISPLQTPSLSQQSKARSASFRKPSISTGGGPLSPGLFSPDGETAPDIYRKQVSRIEELEKENKRLAKEASDSEKRWQKAEEELDTLRESDGVVGGKAGSPDSEAEKLKNEVAALQRQNAQLQSQLSRGSSGGRHGSSPSISMSSPPSEVEAQLRSKSMTIETMELEMSRLRAQVERLSVSASTPSEQITALEEKLARAEKAAALAQRELADLKRNLDRTSEKAVREGSARASAETQVRALQKQATDATAERDELAKKVDALEKKVSTLQTLHKEHDGRTQALRRDKEQLTKDLERAEAEAARLRKKDAAEGGGDDDGVDELEDEGRTRLERRLRELEAENTDLRRGIWHERRKEMQLGPDEAGRNFENVDLGGGSPSLRKAAGGGLGDFFTSGLNALTGGAPAHGNAHGRGEHEELLEDDDFEFDEDAFRRAQEDEQKKRLERIKEIKRSLKNWEGWRLDLVENRRGGGEGIGEIFEV
ncbi:hypothetical protein GQ53DRAFT_645311 [Thozetella sp. PMI_491]|nr:hypothetical protein GQ53DRAFT_645311 [Thozetella sp. PMI_491]